MEDIPSKAAATNPFSNIYSEPSVPAIAKQIDSLDQIVMVRPALFYLPLADAVVELQKGATVYKMILS